MTDNYAQGILKLQQLAAFLYGGYGEPRSERDRELANQINDLLAEHVQAGPKTRYMVFLKSTEYRDWTPCYNEDGYATYISDDKQAAHCYMLALIALIGSSNRADNPEYKVVEVNV